MAETTVQSTPLVTSESKSARKKKAKAEAIANGDALPPAVPDGRGRTDSSADANGDIENSTEHPHIKELSKQIRSIHKKLTGMSKVDAIIAENPDSSLDQLVTQRKINVDQKASALKKPQLQSQLSNLEEQLQQYRKFEAEHQAAMQRQRDDINAQHRKELEKVKDESRVEGTTMSANELRDKLLIFSQFLRCAAAKRTVEDEVESDESRAFEGALLLVYGGDEKAVETAMRIIEGAEEQVPSIEGQPLTTKYSQIKQASIEHAPYQTEENWVDSVAEASAAGAEIAEPDAEEVAPVSDPTIAHAGLTEVDDTAQTNGVHVNGHHGLPTLSLQDNVGDTMGNAAGDSWDPAASGGDRSITDDGYEMVPRPQDDLETPSLLEPGAKTNWADEQPPALPTGNQAGEGWDGKVPGEQLDDTWSGGDALAAAGAVTSGGADVAGGQEEGDGFSQVPGRQRGRGGRGRGVDGEFRGRGRGRGGFRGDGEFRGRGRGGFRGDRGEFRGRGGRGRGPRGGAGEGMPRVA